jgi:hypothetical protein
MIGKVENHIIIILIIQNIIIKVHRILTIKTALIITNRGKTIITFIVIRSTPACQLAIKIILRENKIIK